MKLPMITAPRVRLRSGFTLAELLVVMAILAILMTLTFNAVSYANRNGNIKKTEAQMTAVRAALEKFKADHGSYPRSGTGDEGSKIVYAALSGDTNFDGKITKDDKNWDWFASPNATPGASNKLAESYLPELLTGASSSQGWVDADYYIVDAFGEKINYLADPKSTEMWNPPTHFDLWSFGADEPDEGGNFTEEEKWITNW